MRLIGNHGKALALRGGQLMYGLHGEWKGLNRAHHNLFAANGYPVRVNDGVFMTEVATGQLVGLHNAHGLLDAVHHLKAGFADHVFIRADDADNGARLAAAQMHLLAQFLHTLDHGLNISLAGALFHDDNHSACSLFVGKSVDK